MSYMFWNCCSLNRLPNISKWKSRKDTDMSGMFHKCNKIKIPEKFK